MAKQVLDECRSQFAVFSTQRTSIIPYGQNSTKRTEGVPAYKFDFPVMFISLVCFITVYEILMYVYSEKIKKISIKEIMIE